MTNEQWDEIEDDEIVKQCIDRGIKLADQVTLDDYDDSEIESEYEERDLGDVRADMTEMFEAFYVGQIEKAISIAKRMCEESTGRFLP